MVFNTDAERKELLLSRLTENFQKTRNVFESPETAIIHPRSPLYHPPISSRERDLHDGAALVGTDLGVGLDWSGHFDGLCWVGWEVCVGV